MEDEQSYAKCGLLDGDSQDPHVATATVVLPPLSSSDRGTWRRSFLAAFQKNLLLRRSAYVSSTLEVIMPTLFMLLLSIGYWLSSDDTTPAQSYTDLVLNLSSVVYDSQLFCSYSKYKPEALPSCDGLDTDGWSPVGGTYYGVWTTNQTIIGFIIAYIDTMEQAFTIPDLDSYLVLQGFVSEFFNWGNPFDKSPRASFSHPGSLAIAASDTRVSDAFMNFCTSASFYCESVLFGRVFPTMDDARSYAYVNGQQIWAILDLTQLDYHTMQRGDADDTLPFTISMNYTATPWTFQVAPPFATGGLGRKQYLLYLASGFLTLQQLVSEWLFAEALTGEPGSINTTRFRHTLGPNHVAAAPMPTRATFSSAFLIQSGEFIPLVMVFSMLFGLSRTLSAIVEEKEGRVREALLIMGLPLSAFYASWIATAVVINAVAAIGSTLVLRLTLFNSINPVVMWLVNFCFSLTVMAMSMVLSVFFSKPRIAAIFGPLLMFVSAVPYYAIPEGTSEKYIVAASFLPCTAYAQAVNTFVSYAQNGYGVSFSNMFDGDYSIGLAVWIMLVDTAVYLLIALYLDLVLPSEHGSNRHPLFFMHDLCAWWGARKKRSAAATQSGSYGGGRGESLALLSKYQGGGVEVSAETPGGDAVLVDRLHEVFRPTTPVVVDVRHLVKTYHPEGGGEPIHAVRDISFRLHHGHIHVLLGHNGAGKSSTINMLVGLVPPTAGDISIAGKSLRTSLSSIRRDLGYCPQHNILWPSLTVAQHLRVYARMKSKHWDVESAVASTLDLVQLQDKKNAAAGSLSGGQKRKLCVAISLIGGSKFLLLDEPTAGMDLEARRAMWNMLLQIRKHRCVLLCTHFLDEADLLGDRIIIMNHGKIHSAGTPLFLKARLGIGYSVTCVLDHERHVPRFVEEMQRQYAEARRVSSGEAASAASAVAARDTCAAATNADHRSRSAVTNTTAPGIEEVSQRGKEVVLRFPISFAVVAANVFAALEKRKDELHVTSYGLSLTTMEDVFLNIALLGDTATTTTTAAATVTASKGVGAQGSNDTTPLLQHALLDSHSPDGSSFQPTASPGQPLEAPRAIEEQDEAVVLLDPQERAALHLQRQTFLRHFAAMFVKRFHCAKRDRRMLCFQVVMPVAFLTVALLILLLHPPYQPPLLLNGSGYGEATELLYTPSNGTASLSPNETIFPASGPTSIPALLGNERAWYVPVEVSQCTDVANSSQCLSAALAAEYNSHLEPRYVALNPVCANLGVVPPSSAILHNASVLHALPEGLALTYELAFRLAKDRPLASLEVYNWPMTMSQAQDQLISSIRRIVSAIFILIPFTFIPANFVCFIVKEKECRAKHLQWVAGGSTVAYWCSSLAWDLLTFLATELLCIAVFCAFRRDEFVGDWETFGATFSLFFLYGLSSIPFSYVLSFAFKNSSTAQNVTMMGNFFAGFLLVMAAQILSAIPSTQEVNRWLCKFYRAIPAYALGEGIITLTGRELAQYVSGGSATNPFDLLSQSNSSGGFFGGVGTSLIYLGCAAPFFFLLLIALEGARYISLRLSVGRVRPQPTAEELADYGHEDDDVLAERREAEAVVVDATGAVVQRGRPGDGVVVQHLRKQYSPDKCAVKHSSFGIKVGEVFALLGTNGAGKTTTISTLTGEHVPTCGDAFIHGKSIVLEMHEARKWIGYCPQFDALLEHMTPREHLALYCRLRGLTSSETKSEVSRIMAALNLDVYADTPSKGLSGGNKRKLSLGIALIGDTKCVLLDEPTAGLDPVARRDLWKSLSLITKDRSTVLTTHHLEECESLADRVAIMVDGKIQCIGTLQQLKSKYVGDVFEIQISFAPPRGQSTNTVATSTLTMAGGGGGGGGAAAFDRGSFVLRRETTVASIPSNTSGLTGGGTDGPEERNAQLTAAYYRERLPADAKVNIVEVNGNKTTITVQGAPLSALFRVSEQRKQELEILYAAEEQQDTACDASGERNAPVRRITEYALSQCSLEQVFLRIGLLARQEEEDEAEGRKRSAQPTDRPKTSSPHTGIPTMAALGKGAA